MYREDLKPKTNYPSQLALHLAQSVFPPDCKEVLDIGSGRGELAVALAKTGLQVSAVDNYTQKEVTSLPRSVNWISGSFDDREFPIPGSSFDLVYAKSVIEHLREPLWLIEEAKRLLRPGGMLLILTPDWERNKSRFFDDHTHVTPFTRISMQNLLLLADLAQIRVDYLVPLPQTWHRPALRMVSQAIGPFVPPRVDWKPLRWSRERQILATAVRD